MAYILFRLVDPGFSPWRRHASLTQRDFDSQTNSKEMDCSDI